MLVRDSWPFLESELCAVGAELGEHVPRGCAQGKLAAKEGELTSPVHSLPVVHGRQRSFCQGPAEPCKRALLHGSGTPEKWPNHNAMTEVSTPACSKRIALCDVVYAE